MKRMKVRDKTINLLVHIAVPVALCALIMAFQIRETTEDRLRHLERAQLNAHDLGSTVAISIAGSFENIDLTLQSAADQVLLSRAHTGTSPAAVNQALLKLQQRVPSLLLLKSTDQTGTITYYSQREPSDLLNVADRDYFQTLKSNPSAAMVISRPLLGRITGRWVLICARRIAMPNGEFGGIVFASVELEGFLNRLSGGQIKLSGDDVFLLRDDEGNALIRYAKGRQEMDIVGSKVDSENLSRLGSNRAESGSYVSSSAVDHVERIYYYQRIRNRPMNLVVGIAVSDALAEWQLESRKSWVVTISLMMVILLAGYLVYRSRGRQLQAFSELQYMQVQLEQTNQELQRLSTTDELTGLANRRKFDEVGPHEWMRALRKQESLAVAMLDVDFFKIYNDRYGHQAGDQCLARIARALGKGLRDGSDFIARYGGEEFVILLPGQNAHEAFEVLERLRADIEALAIPHLGSTVESVITLSAGFATIVPEPGITLENLIEQADQNLYTAKRKGKNRVVGGTEYRLASQLYRNLQVFGA